MALLESDIARLHAAFASQGADTPDLAGWLSRLESQYAMREQHQDQAESSSTAGTDSTETTFF
jgi:hypothetical protein